MRDRADEFRVFLTAKLGDLLREATSEAGTGASLVARDAGGQVIPQEMLEGSSDPVIHPHQWDLAGVGSFVVDVEMNAIGRARRDDAPPPTPEQRNNHYDATLTISPARQTGSATNAMPRSAPITTLDIEGVQKALKELVGGS